MQFRRMHDGGFEGKIMDQIIVAGIHKKSFELFSLHLSMILKRQNSGFCLKYLCIRKSLLLEKR